MSGPRSALSESLLGDSDRRRSLQRSSAPLPQVSIDIQDSRSPRANRSGRLRGSSFAHGENASGTENDSISPEIKYGTSPLIGSPWPYLTHRPQLPSSPRRDSSILQVSGEQRRGNSSDSFRSTLTQRRSNRLSPCDEPVEEAEEEDIDGKEEPDSPHKSDRESWDGEKKPSKLSLLGSLANDITYGLINSIVGAPTLISFSAIIFSHKFFNPYIGQLARLTFLSSAIHQATFTVFSTLPFAVGQVQDVGLIFLSAMASSIASGGLQKHDSKEDILGTTLVTLTVSTFIVGLLIILVGQFKLASLVQYVPLSTVGGYLGYVGYFCLAAGVSLACDCTDQLIKLGPVLGSTLFLYLTMHYIRSPLALPAVIILIPLIFHGVLLGIGWSLEDAAEAGWVTKSQEGVQFWKLYGMYNIRDWKLSTIDKIAALKQAPKLLALFFVVAFGSSLDVAAIQAGMPEPLDFNHELKTVGASNLVSGILGAGFTGSYIFSQTIFSMRAGVKSKLHGWIIAGLEFALFLLPISVIQYLPNFFFGSLLALFGVEIILDWLILSFSKVLTIEFLLLWATYLAIMFTNLELGIGIGIVLATMYFAFSYARTFSVVPSRSAVVRGLRERSVLEVFSARMAALSLSGYIFFGSSVSIAKKVNSVAEALLVRESQIRESLQTEEGLVEKEIKSGNPLWAGNMRQKTKDAFLESPMFILLDFRAVHGLDATAAQSFGTLWNQLRRDGIELVLTHLRSKSMHRLLEAHGVVADIESSKGSEPTDAARVFGTMDAGVQYCEERFLEMAIQYQLCKPKEIIMTLEDTIRSQSQIPNLLVGKQLDASQVAKSLQRHMQETQYSAGESIWERGQEADKLFIVEEGNLCVVEDYLQQSQDEQLVPFPENLISGSQSRDFHYGPGAIVGITDWFLERARSCHAHAETNCTLYSIEKQAFDRLSHESPEAVLALVSIIARMAILNELHVGEYLERANAST